MKKKETSKITYPNKKKPTSSKRQTPYLTAKTLLSWRNHDPGEPFIDSLCDSLMKWVSQEDAWDILEFYHWYGIPKATFYELIKKYPSLKLIHTEVMERLGVRRQRYATFRKYGTDALTIHKTLHAYHPDWKQVYDEDRELKLKKLELQEKETKATQTAMAFFGLGMKKNNETDLPG